MNQLGFWREWILWLRFLPRFHPVNQKTLGSLNIQEMHYRIIKIIHTLASLTIPFIYLWSEPRKVEYIDSIPIRTHASPNLYRNYFLLCIAIYPILAFFVIVLAPSAKIQLETESFFGPAPNPPLNSDPACIVFRSLSTFRFLSLVLRLGVGVAG